MASNVQDCDCGFIDSRDPTNSTFASFLAVNFSSITDKKLYDIFLPATYELTARKSPYTRNFSSNQIRLSDTGLELTVSPSSDSKTVPCAEVFTRAATFFYGSYHAQYSVGHEPGTVAAFFNYKNDTSEVDIEYVSAWDVPTLLYTVKPQIYLDNGNPAKSTYQRQSWNDARASFDQGSHEWSYVWLPDIVHFGLDANYSSSLTTNVPKAPGRLALSHWSDGDPNYSLGPPKQNSTVTVSLVWAVYNNSDALLPACEKTTSACIITDGILQGTTTSGGDTDNPPASPTEVIDVNSANRTISPAPPGSTFVILILLWLGCRRFLQ